LPISLYVVFTPGLFALFALASLLYLVSFIMMYVQKKRRG
jgi:uncharacterized membrane protein